MSFQITTEEEAHGMEPVSQCMCIPLYIINLLILNISVGSLEYSGVF